jgi:hypothetical protein
MSNSINVDLQGSYASYLQQLVQGFKTAGTTLADGVTVVSTPRLAIVYILQQLGATGNTSGF